MLVCTVRSNTCAGMLLAVISTVKKLLILKQWLSHYVYVRTYLPHLCVRFLFLKSHSYEDRVHFIAEPYQTFQNLSRAHFISGIFEINSYVLAQYTVLLLCVKYLSRWHLNKHEREKRKYRYRYCTVPYQRVSIIRYDCLGGCSPTRISNTS